MIRLPQGKYLLLTANNKSYYEKQNIKYNPAHFASVFIWIGDVSATSTSTAA
jgi:hypothetical protein